MIVVGSQAILGSYAHDELPPAATMSMEIDILSIAADVAETGHLDDLIEGVAGEFSTFEETHGFSIDGVDLTTAVLPAGWRDRLIKIQNVNTAAPSGQPQYIGWCLDKEDPCVAKLCALREKDKNFVRALLDADLVDADLIATRLQSLDGQHESAAERVRSWLKTFPVTEPTRVDGRNGVNGRGRPGRTTT